MDLNSLLSIPGLDIAKLLEGIDTAKLLELAKKHFGLDFKKKEMKVEPTAEVLVQIARSAMKPGAQFYEVTANAKGEKIRAFIVIEKAA